MIEVVFNNNPLVFVRFMQLTRIQRRRPIPSNWSASGVPQGLVTLTGVFTPSAAKYCVTPLTIPLFLGCAVFNEDWAKRRTNASQSIIRPPAAPHILTLTPNILHRSSVVTATVRSFHRKPDLFIRRRSKQTIPTLQPH